MTRRGKLVRPCLGLVLTGNLVLVLACASMEGPPGGPVDKTPPVLVEIWPDSGAVGLTDCREIRLLFSEKMEPVAATRFLELFPPVEVARTRWHGRREARVELEEALPADTVIVVEVGAGLQDAHRVVSRERYRIPWATAERLPRGELRGHLVYHDKPLTDGLVELYSVPPETLEYFQQHILRRADTDSLGEFRFRWLEVPGGPWLLRAFVDGNDDLRPGENEAQRLLPLEASLDSTTWSRSLGLTTLYDPNTPGRFTGTMDSILCWPGKLMAWPLKIAEEDSGWTAAPQRMAPAGLQAAPLGQTVTWPEAGPGWVRLIFFVDADGDSLLSLLPAAGTVSDTVAWFLEPYAVVDSLFIEPGLETNIAAPSFGDILIPWREAAADSTVTNDPAAGLE